MYLLPVLITAVQTALDRALVGDGIVDRLTFKVVAVFISVSLLSVLTKEQDHDVFHVVVVLSVCWIVITRGSALRRRESSRR